MSRNTAVDAEAVPLLEAVDAWHLLDPVARTELADRAAELVRAARAEGQVPR